MGSCAVPAVAVSCGDVAVPVAVVFYLVWGFLLHGAFVAAHLMCFLQRSCLFRKLPDFLSKYFFSKLARGHF